MSEFQIFTPIAATASLAVTTGTGNVSLGTSGFSNQSYSVRVVAPSDNDAVAFIKFGPSGVVATTGAMPILPGTIELFQIPAASTFVAAITGSSTATLYFTPGEGA